MRIARLFLAIMFTALLCAADEPDTPDARTVIVLAKPVKILKILGTHEVDGVFLVKMKTTSVIRGTFPKRTFSIELIAHTEAYIFLEKEYVAVFNVVDGKYESLGTTGVIRHTCFPLDFLKQTDLLPDSLSRITHPQNHYSDLRCYELP